MKMDKVANSGNDEFYTPFYAIEPLLKYIPAGKSIWCPFDTDESLIVKAFKDKGFKVSATHIQDGHDFFTTEPQGEIIISNPPYSLKGEVFQRLFDLGLPFAMLVGVVGLFESRKRFNMFKENDFEIMWMNKRIAYFKSYAEQKPSLNPPFSSIWLTKSILPKGNVFETVHSQNDKAKKAKPYKSRHSRGVNHEESKPGETVTAGPAATAAPAKQVNQNLSPEEWKAATDYALNLSDKMRASEQRSEETKSRQQKRGHHNE